MRVWTWLGWLARPFGLLCLLIAIGTPPVQAQEGNAENAKQEAKTRYTSAQSHYNLNEFKEALDDFKEAYRLYPDPVFLFNVAQCERQLGDFDEAVKFYRSYLRNKPKAPNRVEVLRRIDEMQAAADAKKSNTDQAPRDSIAPAPSAKPTEPPPVAHTPAVTPATPPISSPSPTATTAPAPKPLPAAVPPAAANTRADLVTQTTTPAPEESPSVFSRWWFWTGVAAVVATGVGSAVILSRGTGSSAPGSGLGNQKVF